jgi:hypothetical protein
VKLLMALVETLMTCRALQRVMSRTNDSSKLEARRRYPRGSRSISETHKEGRRGVYRQSAG